MAKLKIDLHDIYNRGDLIDKELQNPLLTLVNANKLGREKLVQKTYLYVSVDPEIRKKPLTARDSQN